MSYPSSGHPPPPYAAPDHPQAMAILLIGIFGLVFCQLLGPVAWVMGRRALNDIDHSGGAVGGRSTVMVGYVCGIIATVLIVFALVAFVVVILLAVLVGSSTPMPN